MLYIVSVMNIIKLSGSLIYSDKGFNHKIINAYADSIQNNIEKVDAIIVGGGDISRQYIDAGNKVGLSNKEMDLIGIEVTKLNANLIHRAIDQDNVKFVKSSNDAIEVLKSGNIPILGGTEPGQTTDSVAATLASSEPSGKIIMCSKIDGIYDTRDSRIVDKEEQRDIIEHISIDKLESIISNQADIPGRNVPIDKKAFRKLKSFNIPCQIFDGRDIENFEKAINWEHVGTLINEDYI